MIGGYNFGLVFIGVREFREIFLELMCVGIRSGVFGVMVVYNEIDGVLCYVNKEFLIIILWEEMGFFGIVMVDGCVFDRLLKLNFDLKKVVKMVFEVGVDLSLWDEVFLFFEESVEKGIFDEKVVDDVVRWVF